MFLASLTLSISAVALGGFLIWIAGSGSALETLERGAISAIIVVGILAAILSLVGRPPTDRRDHSRRIAWTAFILAVGAFLGTIAMWVWLLSQVGAG